VLKSELHTLTITALHWLYWCYFHRNSSAAGGTDQLVLSVALEWTSWTCLLTARHHVARYDDFYCVSCTDWRDALLGYWSGLRQLHILFYGETMADDWFFLHILCFLHFANNSQKPDQGEEYDRLWKLPSLTHWCGPIPNFITPQSIW
jgi:hypothetical protein